MKNNFQVGITKTFLFFVVLLFSISNLFANNWKNDLKAERSFIVNQGQFDHIKSSSPILYGFESANENYYFTKNGLEITFVQKTKRKKTDEDKVRRIERKKLGFKTKEEWTNFEREGNRIILTKDAISCTWVDANPNASLTPEKQASYYHSYSIKTANGKEENKNFVSSYQKLVYKNLYPNIDAVYEFHPQGGIKYSLVLHAGANLEAVKLHYSKPINLQANGDIFTPTVFGNLIDHKPISFYADNNSNSVASQYMVNQNTISFKLGNYNTNKTVIIDPWVQSPAFNSNWDCVWECEKDALGNVYIIGGVMPLQLLKYNPAGVLQWTYNTPYDTTAWLGTFATDLAGNSYVTNGTYAAIQKISTAGTVVWNNGNPGGLFSSTELWTISFNCDQTKLVVGGTGGFLPPIPYIYDIDMNTGNVLNSIQTNNSGGLFDIEEVRSITSCGNGKYYFLTHDSIGYIHQSLNSCLVGNFPFHVNSGIGLGYKCENWRYDNSGIAALRYSNGFIYVNKGNQLQKRDFNTAAIIASVTIPGGALNNVFLGGNQVGNTGIDIDDCGNIYVGSTNGVYKFDPNLVQLASFPTSFNVYDVVVSTAGDVIACGATGNSSSSSRTGSVQSFAAAACAPPISICCDATVCNVPSLCTTDTPFQLTPTTTGGVWAGTSVSPTGLFDPAISGVGTFTITYSLPCGAETIVITVNSCTALTVCQEVDGTYSVIGGTGPYTWSEFHPAGNTPITNQSECTACGFSWFFGNCLNGIIPVTSCNSAAQWLTYATGSNAPAPTIYPSQVQDNAGTIFTITGPGIVQPCSPCPTITTSTNALVQPLCSNGTGSATIISSGGVGPYTYTWQPGNLSGDSQSTLAAGNYTISVVDANGCTGTMSLTITAPSVLATNLLGVSNATCGAANGFAFANALGGNSPYTYNWSLGANTLQTTSNSLVADTLHNIDAGTYQVLITDGNGCSITSTLTITNTPAPTALLSYQIDASCGVNNGSLAVSASGGTGNFTFQWFGGAVLLQTANNVVNIDSLTALAAGNYLVVVSDAQSCIDSLTLSVNNLNAANVTLITQTNILCFGVDSASAIVQAIGGNSPYTYEWILNGTALQTNTSSATTDTIVTNQAGAYIVSVTDNSGCETNLNVNIAGPTAALNINSLTLTNASCGNSDGTATAIVSGGTLGYTFNWQPTGGSASTATGLSAGNYTLTITDANACTLDSTFIITSLNGPTINIINQTNTTCNGLSNGTATAAATGGTGGLSYEWSSGLGTSTTVNNLAAGTYTIVVTDSLGCTAQTNVTIGQAPIITATISGTPVYCESNNGTAQITASGGTGSLSYLWNNGATSTQVSGLSAGSYNVVVTDSLGCIQIFSVVLPSFGAFSIDAGTDETIQLGNSVELQGNGPANGTYSWSPIESLSNPTISNPLATPDTTTLYVLTINVNGCIASDSVLIIVQEKCGDVFVPSGFSPNGDSSNDILYVRGNCILEIDFKVYDRWGELMFTSTDKNIGWDGTYKGKPVIAGVYVFYVNALVKGETINKQGNVTLIRN